MPLGRETCQAVARNVPSRSSSFPEVSGPLSYPHCFHFTGLLAKKAVEAGLSVKPYIKTSLSPGSGVVTYYLRESGVMPYLSQLGWGTVFLYVMHLYWLFTTQGCHSGFLSSGLWCNVAPFRGEVPVLTWTDTAQKNPTFWDKLFISYWIRFLQRPS